MSPLKKILVTGASGQLGNEFGVLADKYAQFEFIFADRALLDIGQKNAVADYFERNKFYVCINCAAYTAVDKAEDEQEQALAINAEGVENLARICNDQQIHFFHFSTDYVFNGTATKPYKEDDPTDPVNFYGHTKLLGEIAAITHCSSAIIIRTSWVYSHFGKNFVKTMLRLMKERDSIGVVSDQFGSPTYAADLAEAVMQIIVNENFRPGLYHYCNEGIISWYQFAQAIQEVSGSSCEVKEITTASYPTPAKRPAFSALDTKKIKESFGITIPAWRNSLVKCIEELNK